MKHRTTHLEASESVPVADRLGALAETDRLRMLRVLESEELSVGEVAQVMQQPQSTVSRRLKILTETGWLRRRSVGTSAFYTLVHDDLPESARKIWATVRESLDDDPQIHDDLLRLETVLSARSNDSQAYFGRVVGEWDTIRGELFGSGFTPPALLGLLDPDWVVADIGCGTGNAPAHLAAHVKQVIAIDQSEPMLEAAAKRLSHFGNVDFRLGSAEALPIEDGTIDAAMESGRELVSSTFIIPYPPGFPILVPGQVLSPEILAFMRALDVKEVHGYRPELGLRVFTEEALNARMTA